MKKNDPFGFDMSVSSAKKKNPRGRPKFWTISFGSANSTCANIT